MPSGENVLPGYLPDLHPGLPKDFDLSADKFHQQFSDGFFARRL